MENITAPQKVNRKLLLIISMMSSFIGPFMGASVNIALPEIGHEFAMNAVSLSWIPMSFLLSSAVALVPLGKLADIFGRMRLFFYGNIVIAISSILCACAASGMMLISFRLLQGIGSAMIFGTTMAIVTSAFPIEERGKVIGINTTAVYLGLSLAPILGGFLTQLLGWRSLFILIAPICLFSALAVHFWIKAEWKGAENEKFDFQGSLVYVLAMPFFMLGFSKLPDSHAIIVAILGFAGLLFFTRFELRITFPVLNISLFKNNRVFAFSNLAALINYAATFALSFILSLYLQYVKGLTPGNAGMILVAQPILMAIIASESGRLSDKYDPRILASVGMAIIVVGLLLLTILNAQTSNSYIIVCLVILGIGFGMFSSPNTNAVMSSVGKKYLGVASATVATMRLTGQMISMGIATLIIHIFIGESKISPSNIPAFITGTKVIFGVFAILCFLGVFASIARGKTNNNHE